jgi:putative transcriptional regulator
MERPDDLTGQLLVAIPNTAHTAYSRGIMLVTSHWPAGASSLMINQIAKNSLTVTALMHNMGIDYTCNDPIFWGGPDDPTRIHFVHSLDWQCSSTKLVTEHIGVTQEMSILAAISSGDGPENWRCVIGHRISGPGHLDGELQGMPPWIPEHRWLTVPATPANVFRGIGDNQWLHTVNECSHKEVSSWF